MSNASPEIDMPRPSGNGMNSQSAPAESGQSVHQFQPGMGSHPLWQIYMEEMEALRQADIAEGNRLADLEMGQ